MQQWLETKGETYSPEKLEDVDRKAQEFCYSCARADELRHLVLKAAYEHLRKTLQREEIMGKIVLVTNDNCPPCSEVERALKPLIDEGDIEVVDYSSCEECDRDAVSKAGINTFPSLAIRSEEGLVVSPLSLAPKEEAEEEEEKEEAELEEAEEE